MTNQVVSLAWYVFRAKKTGVPRENLTEADYQDILPTVVDLVAAEGIWQASHEEGDALLSLTAIDLTQTDYLDVVAQIYAGVSYGAVKLKPVLPMPPAILHTPYSPQYLASIPDDVRTPAAVKATLERLDEVLAERTFSPSPHGNGLVVGRVQSGKTRNYIGLMLDAADKGWNVIIVLTSAIKALAQQTRSRIAEEFAHVGASNKQFTHELDFLSSETANGIAGAELDGDFLYWGVAMKETNSLNRIRTWLNAEMQPIKKMRVMIIDDEADNATPDANTDIRGNLSEGGDRRAYRRDLCNTRFRMSGRLVSVASRAGMAGHRRENTCRTDIRRYRRSAQRDDEQEETAGYDCQHGRLPDLARHRGIHRPTGGPPHPEIFFQGVGRGR